MWISTHRDSRCNCSRCCWAILCIRASPHSWRWLCNDWCRSWFRDWLSSLFGFVRGVILIGLVIMGAEILQMPDQPWWDDSKMVPYGTAVADWMHQFLDAGVDYIEDSVDI